MDASRCQEYYSNQYKWEQNYKLEKKIIPYISTIKIDVVIKCRVTKTDPERNGGVEDRKKVEFINDI